MIEHYFVTRSDKSESSVRKKVLSLHGLHSPQSAVCSLHGLRFGVTGTSPGIEVAMMRQKDCKEFAQLLNRLREGKHPEDDITILKQRLLNVRPGQNNYNMNMAHLFTKHASVHAHNTAL